MVMDLEKLVELAKEKGIDVDRFLPANNGIATVSEDGTTDLYANAPWGKLKSGNGFVKFGKLIMPEMDFRDEENYPYLTATDFPISKDGTIYGSCLLVCESKEMPDDISEKEILFKNTTEKKVHMCFIGKWDVFYGEEFWDVFAENEWYHVTDREQYDEVMEEFLETFSDQFDSKISTQYSFCSNYDTMSHEKDSIESLQGMDFMHLYCLKGERIEDGVLEDCMKVGEYIEAPSKGMFILGYCLGIEIKFPDNENEIVAVNDEKNKAWFLKEGEAGDLFTAIGDDAAAQFYGAKEPGIYMNYAYASFGFPVYLIIPHQTTDYLVNSQSLTDIANSIRSKLGTSDKILLEDMPNAIKGIPTTGDYITITWDGQPTEESYDGKYYKVSNLYFNGTQLSKATVTLTNGTDEVTGDFNDTRWNTGTFVTGSNGIAWGLDLMLFSTDGTNEDLGVSKGTYIGTITTGDYAGYYVKSITYPVTPDVALQEKTITANGTYSASADYDGFSKVVVEVESGSATEPYIEEIYDEDGNLIDANMVGHTKIRDYAFYQSSKLGSIKLPDGVTNIEGYAFEYDKSLTLLKLPKELIKIGSAAFRGCTGLILTELPEKMVNIYSGTFQGCNSLVTMSFRKGIKNIYTHAFYSCKNLETVTFDGTPEFIDGSAFKACTNLTTINVPWAEGEVANAPWGATNATINYNYAGGGVMFNLSDFGGYYNVLNDAGANVKTEFEIGEFPLTLEHKRTTSGTFPQQDYPSFKLTLSELFEKAQAGDEITVAFRFPDIQYSWGGETSGASLSIDVNIYNDTNNLGVQCRYTYNDDKITLTTSSAGVFGIGKFGELLSNARTEKILEDDRTVGFTLTGTLLDKIEEIQVYPSFSGKAVSTYSTTITYESYDDLKITVSHTQE